MNNIESLYKALTESNKNENKEDIEFPSFFSPKFANDRKNHLVNKLIFLSAQRREEVHSFFDDNYFTSVDDAVLNKEDLNTLNLKSGESFIQKLGGLGFYALKFLLENDLEFSLNTISKEAQLKALLNKDLRDKFLSMYDNALDDCDEYGPSDFLSNKVYNSLVHCTYYLYE